MAPLSLGAVSGGTLDFEPGASLATGGASVGALLLDGATMQAPGTVSTGTLTVENGATLTATALTTGSIKVDRTSVVRITSTLNPYNAAFAINSTATVAVQGVLEFGTAGGAPVGTLTVDAGETATIAGLVTTPILDNGLIGGSSTLYPAISGIGTLTASSATFAGPVAAGLTVALLPSATLTLPATGFAATIGSWALANSSSYSTGTGNALLLPAPTSSAQPS